MKKTIDTLLTIGKVMIKSRPVERGREEDAGRRLIVMGNGPSLRDTLSNHKELLAGSETTAVNFAANTEEYRMLKPRHYILADPHFFKKEGRAPGVAELWAHLRETDWRMTLHVPAGEKPDVPYNIKVRHFNMTSGEGHEAVTHRLYRAGLAMPRPRNVPIPALMEGIRDGYKEIYITGADHTWPHSLYVDDENRVVSVQPHYYEDNKKELDRVAQEYASLRLHDVLGSMVVAFRSYHAIRKYAEREGVEIYNSTPGSLIDAFKRRSLPD